jgi:hypothetical protein
LDLLARTYEMLCSVLRGELRARQDLVAENLGLRQQLAVLTAQSAAHA